MLLEEWLPKTPRKSPDEALATLCRRYFSSHGPATVHDFAVWTGLTLRDARAGLESVRQHLISETHHQLEYWWVDETLHAGAIKASSPQGSAVHLLPGFDEYLLGYKNRRDVIEAEHATRIVPGGNGVFLPMMVALGQVVGTWKRTVKKNGVQIVLEPFLEIEALRERVHGAIQRYCAFTDLPLLDLQFRATGTV